jgi:hypothetical protein
VPPIITMLMTSSSQPLPKRTPDITWPDVINPEITPAKILYADKGEDFGLARR